MKAMKDNKVQSISGRRASRSFREGKDLEMLALGEIEEPIARPTLMVPPSFERKASIIRKSIFMEDSP